MVLTISRTATGREYKVKDISQADFGRLEIEQAEVEMLGLNDFLITGMDVDTFPDGVMRATDVIIDGKIAFVCGYGDVEKGCAAALKAAGARVIVTLTDPMCALQALMDSLPVLLGLPRNKRITVKPQTDRWVFPETNRGFVVVAEGRLVNLGCGTGHPSFLMSCSFTNQVIAQMRCGRREEQGKYENKDYMLPKHLDEIVAALHLGKPGEKLTKLTQQVAYINVPVEGPH
ncbi:hypothetical protein CRYUN_Cryun12cG0168600 [Craigia yunnanensis]